jgi:hypothetical protein
MGEPQQPSMKQPKAYIPPASRVPEPAQGKYDKSTCQCVGCPQPQSLTHEVSQNPFTQGRRHDIELGEAPKRYSDAPQQMGKKNNYWCRRYE